MLKICRTICILLLAFFLVPGSAYAYLDPGTGSMIIQVVVAGTAAALLVIRTYWEKIKSMFGGGKSLEADGSDEDHEEQ